MLKIYDDSKNYTAQIVRLHNTQKLEGLDNLVGASIQGNLALIAKDYPVGELYIFFPSGCYLSDKFIGFNNLFRENTLNQDINKKGFFEPNCRVKAVKFRGHKSTALLCPIAYLSFIGVDISTLKEGDEFNEIDGVFICRKYILPFKGTASQAKKVKLLDEIIDSRFLPEHMGTDMLLKYLNHLDLNDYIVISTKLHGTSARVGHTLTKRKLSLFERIAKFFGCKVQDEEYNYVVGSHHVIKSLNFQTLSGKNHFYSEDLWSKVSEEFFKGKLLKSEIVYYEIIGKDYTGKEIQKDYAYGLNKPDVYVYRISHITPEGVEIDLSWRQVKARCNEMGVKYVPDIWDGKLNDYCKIYGLLDWDDNGKEIWRDNLQKWIVAHYLDKPSSLDKSVIEEGICLRREAYPRPKIYKVKSPLFYIHEGVLLDRGIEDIEETQV
jgi:hypothetical protein